MSSPEASQSSVEARHVDIRTFADAERVTRSFSDHTLLAMLNGDLNESGFVPGEADIHRWAVLAQPSREDAKVMANAQEIGALRANTLHLVADNFALRFDPSVPFAYREHAKQAQADYAAALKQATGKQLQTTLEAWVKGDVSARAVGQATKVPGLELPTSAGAIDVTNRFGGKIKNVRPTISFQREVSNTAVHWMTRAAADKALELGHSPAVQRRIYLAPQVKAQVKVFEHLMQYNDRHGWQVMSKMMERAGEFAAAYDAAQAGHYNKIRTEGVVLTVGNEHADELLQYVLRLHAANGHFFAGQPTPRLAFAIGPGLAIADEPHGRDGESFNGQRVRALSATVAQTRMQLGLQPGQKVTPISLVHARKVYDPIWQAQAKAAHINPHNIAFNART